MSLQQVKDNRKI